MKLCPHPLITHPYNIHNGWTRESGFLMMGLLAVVLALAGAMIGLVKYQDESRRWEIYYAFGQQIASVARSMHAQIQEASFAPALIQPVPAPATPVPATQAEMLTRPGNLEFGDTGPTGLVDHRIPIWGVQSALDIRPVTARQYGLDYRAPPPISTPTRGEVNIDVYAGLSPIGAPAAIMAPSVYLFVRMITVPPHGILSQRGRDLAAVRAGASNKGLSNFGVVDFNAPNAPNCRGTTARVWWSNDAYGCLNDADLAQMNTSINNGDIVIAAWLSKAPNLVANNVLHRYPQPGNPTLTQMDNHLLMGNNNIVDAAGTQTQTANTANNAEIRQNLAVNGGTTFDGQIDITGMLNVKETLTVAGTTTVTGDAKSGADITVANNLFTPNTVQATTSIDTGRNGTFDTITIKDNINVTNAVAKSKLTVTGGEVTSINLYADQIKADLVAADTLNSGTLQTPNLALSSNSDSRFESVNVSGTCTGEACPDNVDSNPTAN